MTALLQTLSTLRHRPGRTLLTALGSALGIATIVALLAVSGGARHSAGDFLHLGASDLGLFQKDAADPTTSVLPTSLIPQLRRTPGYRRRHAARAARRGSRQGARGDRVRSRPRRGFLTNRLVFSSGRMYRSPDEIVVGDGLARQLHTVGRRPADRAPPQAPRRRHLPHRCRLPGLRRVHPADAPRRRSPDAREKRRRSRSSSRSVRGPRPPARRSAGGFPASP